MVFQRKLLFWILFHIFSVLCNQVLGSGILKSYWSHPKLFSPKIMKNCVLVVCPHVFEPWLIVTHHPIKPTFFPGVFLGKGVLKRCSKFTGEHPYRGVIAIKLQKKFIEIALRYRCSPVELLHILRTPFYKNTYGRLLLYWCTCLMKSSWVAFL